MDERTKAALIDELKVKCELLCNGFIISNRLLDKLHQEGRSLNLGRKGGAGPAGGRYFEFPDGSILNIPLFIEQQPNCHLVVDTIDLDGTITYHDQQHQIPEIPLKLIAIPKFYDNLSTEGYQLRQIALIHGNDTLASTINQRCHYWRNQEQCKFCAIELSLETGATIEKKSGAQIIEAINAAKRENPAFANHLTLTIGSSFYSDQTLKDYVAVLHEIKRIFPTIMIHIQNEPVENLSFYDQVHAAGADTIGIHLEVLDPQIRQQVCPGKSKIPLAQYYRNWDHAIGVFGINQVNTFILTGFEPFDHKYYTELDNIIAHRVIPFLTPARTIVGVKYTIPATNPNEYYQILMHVAQKLKFAGLNPLDNKAGCVRCGGCSPLLDAYKLQ